MYVEPIYLKAKIVQIELKAVKVIQDATCELLRFVTEFPNIGDILEGTIRKVKLDPAIIARRLQHKQSAPINDRPTMTKKQKKKTVKSTLKQKIKCNQKNCFQKI